MWKSIIVSAEVYEFIARKDGLGGSIDSKLRNILGLAPLVKRKPGRIGAPKPIKEPSKYAELYNLKVGETYAWEFMYDKNGQTRENDAFQQALRRYKRKNNWKTQEWGLGGKWHVKRLA